MVRTNTRLVCPNSVSEHGSKVTDKPSVLKRLRMLKELSPRQVLAEGLTRPARNFPSPRGKPRIINRLPRSGKGREGL
jgi:hypothetical protein